MTLAELFVVVYFMNFHCISREEDVATLYTKKSFPNFFFKTFYALKKSNLENNRANERVEKERKRKV